MPVSNTQENNPRLSQRTFTGFGMELSDSLNRYSTWKLSAEPKDRLAAQQLVTGDYTRWFRECPHRDHVCFADITFFSPDKVSVKDALTLVFTPESRHLAEGGKLENHSAYVRVLRDEYLKGGKGHTMAPHEVFRQGLPQLNHADGRNPEAPETVRELEAFFSSIRENNGAEKLSNGAFWMKLEASPQDLATSPQEQNAWSDNEIQEYWAEDIKEGTYGGEGPYNKHEFTDDFAQRVSKEPISEQFMEWCRVWGKHRHLLKSALGHSICHIVALPIGFRNPDNSSDYTPVSCVFLCVDCIADHQQVKEIIRYIFLHILESNATAWVLRKGDFEGRDAAMVPASHEISRVISAIQPGLPVEAYGLLRGYFRLLLPKSHKLEVSADYQAPRSTRLIDFITSALILGSRINALSLLAESNSDGISNNLQSSEILAYTDNASKEAQECSKITFGDSNFELCGKDEDRHLFYLALLGAVRNALRHSVKAAPWTIEFDLNQQSSSKDSRPVLLVVRNTRSDFIRGRAIAGEATGGTLKALRAYARNYGKDPRLVRLERVSILEDRTRSLPFTEIWHTVIPLPGNL